MTMPAGPHLPEGRPRGSGRGGAPARPSRGALGRGWRRPAGRRTDLRRASWRAGLPGLRLGDARTPQMRGLAPCDGPRCGAGPGRGTLLATSDRTPRRSAGRLRRVRGAIVRIGTDPAGPKRDRVRSQGASGLHGGMESFPRRPPSRCRLRTAEARTRSVRSLQSGLPHAPQSRGGLGSTRPPARPRAPQPCSALSASLRPPPKGLEDGFVEIRAVHGVGMGFLTGDDADPAPAHGADHRNAMEDVNGPKEGVAGCLGSPGRARGREVTDPVWHIAGSHVDMKGPEPAGEAGPVREVRPDRDGGVAGVRVRTAGSLWEVERSVRPRNDSANVLVRRDDGVGSTRDAGDVAKSPEVGEDLARCGGRERFPEVGGSERSVLEDGVHPGVESFVAGWHI